MTGRAIDLDLSEAHREFLLRNLAVIHDILAALYGSPNHGNKSDPMDELIYIHLSKRTREVGYVKAYQKLSKAFPGWGGLADASPNEVVNLIRASGLGRTRAREIVANAKTIRDRFGKETLDRLRKWPEKKIFEFLVTLKGVGPKSARCVMMYSLGKKVFPVDTHVHRVCSRLGFMEMRISHKKAQEELKDLFPKKYRYALHVNMVAHGREVCWANRPKCSVCQIKRFCNFYRHSLRGRGNKRPVMVDLFCGPGGASCGFEEAGFDVVFASDIDQCATDTFYLNHPQMMPSQIYTGDMRSATRLDVGKEVTGKVDLVFAGPPCQGWSRIGKFHVNSSNMNDFFDDERNALFFELVNRLDEISPKCFVMENVPGLSIAHGGEYVTVIEREFLTHGYAMRRLMLNAADYGIAQNRSRLLFIGCKIDKSRDDAEKRLDIIKTSIEGAKTERRLSFRAAVSGLPHLAPGEGANVLRIDGKRIQGNSRTNSSSLLVFNHEARQHNPRDLRIFRRLTEGENYLRFSRRTENKELLPYSTESFHTKFRKIKGDEPAYTIISHLHKDSNSYIHPDDNRGITVREAARIQSFPDDFIFLAEGFRQFILVGNALPPKLAHVIGSAIMGTIEKEEMANCQVRQPLPKAAR